VNPSPPIRRHAGRKRGHLDPIDRANDATSDTRPRTRVGEKGGRRRGGGRSKAPSGSVPPPCRAPDLANPGRTGRRPLPADSKVGGIPIVTFTMPMLTLSRRRWPDRAPGHDRGHSRVHESAPTAGAVVTKCGRSEPRIAFDKNCQAVVLLAIRNSLNDTSARAVQGLAQRQVLAQGPGPDWDEIHGGKRRRKSCPRPDLMRGSPRRTKSDRDRWRAQAEGWAGATDNHGTGGAWHLTDSERFDRATVRSQAPCTRVHTPL